MATLGDAVEISFLDFTIPAALLGDVTTSFPTRTRERNTQAGTFTRASNSLDNPNVTAQLFIPSLDWLGKNILKSKYSAPTAPAKGGNVVWNSDVCATLDAGPVNIHPACNDTDDDDIFLYNAELQVNFETTFNNSDEPTVELVFHANPDDNGNVYRLGSGDLTALSHYDAATTTTVANS